MMHNEHLRLCWMLRVSSPLYLGPLVGLTDLFMLTNPTRFVHIDLRCLRIVGLLEEGYSRRSMVSLLLVWGEIITVCALPA